MGDYFFALWEFLLLDIMPNSCYNVFNCCNIAIIYTILLEVSFMNKITERDIEEVYNKIKKDNTNTSTKKTNTDYKNAMMSYREFCHKYSIYTRQF